MLTTPTLDEPTDCHLDDFMQSFGNECLQYVSPAPFILTVSDVARSGEELHVGSLHETIKTVDITSHWIWCVLMLS